MASSVRTYADGSHDAIEYIAVFKSKWLSRK